MEEPIYISIFNSSEILLAHNHLVSLRKIGIVNTISYCTNEVLSEKLNKHGFTSKFIDEKYSKNEFSYIRFKIMLELLEKYKHVWYLDVDTVILGDIWKAVNKEGDWDIQFQDECMVPSTGNILAKNTEKTKYLLELLYKNINKEFNGQNCLSGLLKERKLEQPINIKIMSIYKFCTGILIFSNHFLVKLNGEKKKLRDTIKKHFIETFKKNNLPYPLLIQANYILTNENKIKAMKYHKLWFI